MKVYFRRDADIYGTDSINRKRISNACMFSYMPFLTLKLSTIKSK